MKQQPVPVALSKNLGKIHRREFLNAYQVSNVNTLTWDVRTYKIQLNNPEDQTNQDRGKLKSLFWDLRRQYSSFCHGYGFVIDVSKDTVIVPAAWVIPDQDDFDGYQVTLENSITVCANNSEHQIIVLGIIRESIKNHFKNQAKYQECERIGALWQNYGNFCQLPSPQKSYEDVDYCRQFNVSPKILQGGILTLQFATTTASMDSRSFADYYQTGDVAQLAEMIRIKRGNRLNRNNKPVSVRVLCMNKREPTVMDLARPEDVFDHACLPPVDQQTLAVDTIRCKPYKKPVMNIPLNNLRLILDSRLAGGSHSDTILDPDERTNWHNILREFFDGMECYGQVIKLEVVPISVDRFDGLKILPPAISVRSSNGGVQIISAPKNFSRHDLNNRRKARERAVFNNGFLEQRPVNLLLTAQQKFGRKRVMRMQSDLNSLLKKQGIPYRFNNPLLFGQVPDIKRAVQRGEYDAIFVVLPESRHEPYTNDDTHEKVKKQIQVPSQCIHFDNTLPSYWAGKDKKEFQRKKTKQARRIERHYRQSLLGLLVKHNWIPFAPADSFNYNVQIGIDVGGQHNTEVMLSIGYGFSNPQQHGLVFLLKHIKVNSQQSEPILVEPLYSGLLELFDELKQLLDDAGIPADFHRVLVFRDGAFLGQSGIWNELDALRKMYITARDKRHWITDNALWTGVELSKRAEYWRVFRQENQSVYNPLVGRCIFAFDDPNQAIVCTTGSPYLTQGTALPLLAQIINIEGEANRKAVLRDLIWSADMCFTKLDTGMRLPWVLNVADSGALQVAKAYKITGVTV